MSLFKKKGGASAPVAPPPPPPMLNAAEQEAREQRDIAYKDLVGSFGAADQQLENSKAYFNPEQSQRLFSTALNKFNNFDADADTRANEAYNANYNPILKEVTANLGNSFAGMGSAGRSNSRGQFAQAMLSSNLADNAGKQLLDIRNNARNQLMGENQALLNPSMALMQQLAGIDASKAGVQSQLGQSLANSRLGFQGNVSGIQTNAAQMAQQQWAQQAQIAQQQAQQQAQEKANKKSGIGSLIGGGISLAGSAFSDERLKENIRPLGKLDNGVPIYIYNIKGSELPQIGVLAQEAQLYRPNAVSRDKSGYLKVDYAEVAR